LAYFQENLNFFDRISEKNLNIKFHQNPSSGSRFVPCGQKEGRKAGRKEGRTDRQTDRHDEANSRFAMLRTCLRNLSSYHIFLSKSHKEWSRI